MNNTDSEKSLKKIKMSEDNSMALDTIVEEIEEELWSKVKSMEEEDSSKEAQEEMIFENQLLLKEVYQLSQYQGQLQEDFSTLQQMLQSKQQVVDELLQELEEKDEALKNMSLKRELFVEKVCRHEKQGRFDKEAMTIRSLRRELETERDQHHKTETLYKGKVAELNSEVELQKAKSDELNRQLQQEQAITGDLRDSLQSKRHRQQDTAQREKIALQDLEAKVDLERSKMIDLQMDLERDRYTVKTIAEKLDGEKQRHEDEFKSLRNNVQLLQNQKDQMVQDLKFAEERQKTVQVDRDNLDLCLEIAKARIVELQMHDTSLQEKISDLDRKFEACAKSQEMSKRGLERSVEIMRHQSGGRSFPLDRTSLQLDRTSLTSQGTEIERLRLENDRLAKLVDTLQVRQQVTESSMSVKAEDKLASEPLQLVQEKVSLSVGLQDAESEVVELKQGLNRAEGAMAQEGDGQLAENTQSNRLSTDDRLQGFSDTEFETLAMLVQEATPKSLDTTGFPLLEPQSSPARTFKSLVLAIMAVSRQILSSKSGRQSPEELPVPTWAQMGKSLKRYIQKLDWHQATFSSAVTSRAPYSRYPRR